MAPAGQQAHEFDREDIQAAIARAAELRALHAALLQGGRIGNPSTLRLSDGASPSFSRASRQFTAEEYPIFRPSYQEEPFPASHYLRSESQTVLATSSRIGLPRDEEDGKQDLFDDKKEIFPSSLSSEGQMFSTINSQKLCTSSCTNHAFLRKTVSRTDNIMQTTRYGSGEFEVVTACNKCKPATISRVIDSEHNICRSTGIAAHASGTHQSSLQFHQNNRRMVLSWLFPRSNRKLKPNISPKRLEPEVKYQVVKDKAIRSVETLKKELIDATEDRDSALAEVGEMRSSLNELKQKLMHLEAYCKELKKALKWTMKGKDVQFMETHNMSKRTKLTSSTRACSIPVSNEVMLEGFLQIVSEARLSVKQFCMALISHNDEADIDLIEKLNALAQSNDLTLNSRCSKGLLYHLESLINQTLHQDFENCVFQTSGMQKILDPRQYCLENFSAFVALRSLSWKEVLERGSEDYSQGLNKFCDKKMSTVVSLLDWSGSWPEQLCQCFFVAAKCIWLLHLLAFSFNPPLVILRVEENRRFDPHYMEDILLDRQGAHAPTHVKIMVMPGFYVQDRVVIRCKVLCSYKSVI